MIPVAMHRVHSLMRQALAEKVFAGAVLLAARQESLVFFEAYGYANIFSRRAMTRDTVFDLASLTKPLATSLAVMQLVAGGELELECDLGRLLPEFANTDKAGIKVRHLLQHTAGLAEWRPYYQSLRRLPQKARTKALRNLLAAEPLVYPIGTKVLYSDLGFMILGWLIQHLTGQRLDHFVAARIYRPLGLADLFFVDLNGAPVKRKFAATEKCPWRHVVLEGQVHDDNAYTVGGIQGHAGLFGTAADIHLLLEQLLRAYNGRGGDCLFSSRLVRYFFEPLPGTDKALGFDTPSRQGSSCGRLFSRRSVGHLGFTGTSFWMDLERGLIVVLLTNRVHPTRDNPAIKAFRPQLHDALMQALLCPA